MKNIAAIVMKELYTYFVSPVAYFVFFIFTAVSGFFFFFIFFNVVQTQAPSDVVMESLFPTMSVILLFFTPALTMKLFAEERKSGTIELMSTSPVRDTEMVFGKFLASLVLTLFMLLLTLLFPILIAAFGEIDMGKIASGYLGLYPACVHLPLARSPHLLNEQKSDCRGADQFRHSVSPLDNWFSI